VRCRTLCERKHRQSTPSTTVVITGANKGIGLAPVTEFRRHDHLVVATYRSRSTATELLAKIRPDPAIVPVELDVRHDASTERFVATVAEQVERMDVLVNNAGIAARGTILTTLLSALEDHAQTHAIGMVRTMRAVLRLLGSGSVVADISSILSRMPGSRGWTYYAPAKTFQNAMSLQLASALRPRGVVVVSLHPGWGATDVGGAGAPITPQEAAQTLVCLLRRISPAKSGAFFDYTGSRLSW
jgi:NAD(P)-dependent dehydrogenase (short-subunit alcohol dehydrogenase family)